MANSLNEAPRDARRTGVFTPHAASTAPTADDDDDDDAAPAAAAPTPAVPAAAGAAAIPPATTAAAAAAAAMTWLVLPADVALTDGLLFLSADVALTDGRLTDGPLAEVSLQRSPPASPRNDRRNLLSLPAERSSRRLLLGVTARELRLILIGRAETAEQGRILFEIAFSAEATRGEA
ncbi:unnamed protein product [Closterium sp. NIES-54]